MFLVAGLGNPGDGYALNRHNIGFMAADKLVCRHNFLNYKNKFEAKISQGNIKSEQVLIIKPQTFMNLSGNAVAKAAKFYKIPKNQIIVIHDDLDLDVGKIKVKIGGGNGGHNGLKSIDQCLGDKNYIRIRIGIGRPEYSSMVTNYVLGDFSKEDFEIIDQKLDLISDNFDYLIKQDINGFMNKISANNKKNKKTIEKKEKIEPKKVKENSSILEEKGSIMQQAFAKALSLISNSKDTEQDKK